MLQPLLQMFLPVSVSMLSEIFTLLFTNLQLRVYLFQWQVKRVPYSKLPGCTFEVALATDLSVMVDISESTLQHLEITVSILI
jgi:hypothetical protein